MAPRASAFRISRSSVPCKSSPGFSRLRFKKVMDTPLLLHKTFRGEKCSTEVCGATIFSAGQKERCQREIGERGKPFASRASRALSYYYLSHGKSRCVAATAGSRWNVRCWKDLLDKAV